jgi:hypothetical protein
MNLTGLLVPTYRNMLGTLSGLLDKAEAQLGADRAETLLSARLAPDMFPLATQIRFAVAQAYEGPRRLRGEPDRPEIEEILNEGRNAGEKPGTLAEARARIDEALAYLDTLGPEALDQASEDEPMALNLPMGIIFDLTRGQFARDWALGQFYFHVTAAYAILRKEGIAIGKADYVPPHVPLHPSRNHAGSGIEMPNPDALFLLPSAVLRDPAVEAWFDLTDPMRHIVQPWFDYMRALGEDVRECLHDHMPTACVAGAEGPAAFAYVNAFTAHASVGFFHGASLPDPAGLLEGSGKRMRHVKLRPGAEVDEDALSALIGAAYADVRGRVDK